MSMTNTVALLHPDPIEHYETLKRLVFQNDSQDILMALMVWVHNTILPGLGIEHRALQQAIDLVELSGEYDPCNLAHDYRRLSRVVEAERDCTETLVWFMQSHQCRLPKRGGG